jgi:hypothetical protein
MTRKLFLAVTVCWPLSLCCRLRQRRKRNPSRWPGIPEPFNERERIHRLLRPSRRRLNCVDAHSTTTKVRGDDRPAILFTKAYSASGVQLFVAGFRSRGVALTTSATSTATRKPISLCSGRHRTWNIFKSSTNSAISFQFGVSTDKPVAGDYDGDGKIDPAVYRPATGVWHILLSSTNFTSVAAYQWEEHRQASAW